MFEAKLASAALLKKIVEAIKDLVTDAPFDCTENAVCLQVCLLNFLCFANLCGYVIFGILLIFRRWIHHMLR